VVTLVWYDYPSAPNAAVLLVNDLDLSVRAAGLAGLELRGNGWEDDINTVERVSRVGVGYLGMEKSGHMACREKVVPVLSRNVLVNFGAVTQADAMAELAVPQCDSASDQRKSVLKTQGKECINRIKTGY
jgi:hypothetical protein